MPAGLLLAALVAATAGVVAWLERDVRRRGEPRSVMLVASVLLAFGWAYAVISAVIEHVWPMGVAPGLALVIGVPVALAGAWLVAAGEAPVNDRPRPRRRLPRSRHPDSAGATLLLAGIAISGRSGLACLLSTAFAGFALLYAHIESRVVERRTRDRRTQGRPARER